MSERDVDWSGRTLDKFERLLLNRVVFIKLEDTPSSSDSHTPYVVVADVFTIDAGPPGESVMNRLVEEEFLTAEKVRQTREKMASRRNITAVCVKTTAAKGATTNPVFDNAAAVMKTMEEAAAATKLRLSGASGDSGAEKTSSNDVSDSDDSTKKIETNNDDDDDLVTCDSTVVASVDDETVVSTCKYRYGDLPPAVLDCSDKQTLVGVVTAREFYVRSSRAHIRFRQNQEDIQYHCDITDYIPEDRYVKG